VEIGRKAATVAQAMAAYSTVDIVSPTHHHFPRLGYAGSLALDGEDDDRVRHIDLIVGSMSSRMRAALLSSVGEASVQRQPGIVLQ
jgi:hypothetical protein